VEETVEEDQVEQINGKNQSEEINDNQREETTEGETVRMASSFRATLEPPIWHDKTGMPKSVEIDHFIRDLENFKTLNVYNNDKKRERNRSRDYGRNRSRERGRRYNDRSRSRL